MLIVIEGVLGVVVEAGRTAQRPIWRVEIKERPSLGFVECGGVVAVQDFHPLQKPAVSHDGLLVADGGPDILAEGNVEQTFLVHPVEPVEASPVQEDEELGVVQRREALRVKLRPLLQEKLLALRLIRESVVLRLNFFQGLDELVRLLLHHRIALDQVGVDIVDDRPRDVAVMAQHVEEKSTAANKGLNVGDVLPLSKVARQQIDELGDQLPLPANPLHKGLGSPEISRNLLKRILHRSGSSTMIRILSRSVCGNFRRAAEEERKVTKQGDAQIN